MFQDFSFAWKLEFGNIKMFSRCLYYRSQIEHLIDVSIYLPSGKMATGGECDKPSRSLNIKTQTSNPKR